MDRTVITLDIEGRITHWNEAAQIITGYTEEVVGRPLVEIFGNEEAGAGIDILREAEQRGRSEREGWFKRADGTFYYAVTAVHALVDHHRRASGFALMLRDLTPNAPADLLQSELQLRQAQRMEAVGRLASGIAHDFNNLLTAIHGHAQFLIEDLSDNDRSRPDAEEILHSAQRAAALTRQLLAFTRGEAVEPKTIDVNYVVTSMERLLRRVISESITLETSLEEALWPVRADPSQLEQILVNLVVNARDAMPDGGSIMIRTANAELAESYAARHEEVAPGDYVMIAVSDTGMGMDHQTQSRIFEPFFTTKEPGKGTGLGLSTVFAIVREAGGHIFVYSEPGKGTVAKIYLPSVDDDVHSRTGRVRAPQRAKGGETVLIVEDDDAVRALARRVLETRGYAVVTASSAEDAKTALEDAELRPELLITDLVLPDISGADLAGIVRAKLPQCRVLLMSGYAAEDVQLQGSMPAGAGFIEKPFTPDAFAQKVRALLDARD